MIGAIDSFSIASRPQYRARVRPNASGTPSSSASTVVATATFRLSQVGVSQFGLFR
jgi:hypothetical protein